MSTSRSDIQVFNETGFSIPLSHSDFEKAAKIISENDECRFKFIELVYVDESEIVRLNKEHLDRKYITDIITFRYDDNGNREIEGTLFCCAPRISEQAEELGEDIEREFLRIFIHGLLHLAGYDDQTESQKQKMTQREEFYLELLGF